MVESLKEARALKTGLTGLPADLPEAVTAVIRKGKMEHHEFWAMLESKDIVELLRVTDTIRDGSDPELKKQIESVWAYFQKGQRRHDWEVNHKRIKAAILSCIGEKNCMPSVAQIGKETGISRVTITNHLREFSQNEFFGDEVNKYRLAFFGMLDLLIGEAMHGNMQAIKTYIDVFKFAAKYSDCPGNFMFPRSN
ncbi:MAG: hypothetical protein H6581_06405 [Bacteroidia bacterium]|nr:hypothetical protein [Bacteroidia bacterium]